MSDCPSYCRDAMQERRFCFAVCWFEVEDTLPFLLTFALVLDDIEHVFDLVISLCTLLTEATQERRFCFAATMGLSTVDAGLLQAADDDSDDDIFLEGAGQKLGSAVLILRPFSSYWLRAETIFLLCIFSKSSKLLSFCSPPVSHLVDLCFSFSVSAKAWLPIPLLLEFSGIAWRDLWPNEFFSSLSASTPCWGWVKVPIFTHVSVARIGLTLSPNTVSLKNTFSFNLTFWDTLVAFLLAPSADWLEHCPGDDEILEVSAGLFFTSGNEGSSRLFRVPCWHAPLTAFDNNDVLGEEGDMDDMDDEEDLRVRIRTGDIGEWLTGTCCGEMAAASFKLLLLPSLFPSCCTSPEIKYKWFNWNT